VTLLDMEHRRFYTWLFSSSAYDRISQYGDRYSGVGLFKFLIDPDGTIHCIDGGYTLDTSGWSGDLNDETTTMNMFWKPSDGVEYSMDTNPTEYRAFIDHWRGIKELHPHLKFYLTIRQDGARMLFKALGKNWQGNKAQPAQTKFKAEVERLINEWDFIDGIDFDLERGNYCTADEVLSMASMLYDTVKAFPNLDVNWCLPPMEGPGTPYWEAWCDYSRFHNYFDSCIIMSYAFAWAGSAPGPLQPQWWMDSIYDYAVDVMPVNKVSLGIGGFGFRWNITQLQVEDSDGNINDYRGASGGMWAWYDWMNGKLSHTDKYRGNTQTQPYIPFAGFYQLEDHCPYLYLHIYDYLYANDYDVKNRPSVVIEPTNNKQYAVTYAKTQAEEADLFPQGIETRWIPSVEDTNKHLNPPGAWQEASDGSIATKTPNPTLNEVQGEYNYYFNSEGGTKELVLYTLLPFFGKDTLYIEINGVPVMLDHIPWWRPGRMAFQYVHIGTVNLNAGSNLITVKGPPDSSSGFRLGEFLVAPAFHNKWTAGSSEYTGVVREFKGWMNSDIPRDAAGNIISDSLPAPSNVYPNNNEFVIACEVLRRPPDYFTVWPDDWRYKTADGSLALMSSYWTFFKNGRASTPDNAITGTYPEPLITPAGDTVIGFINNGDFDNVHVRAQYNFSRGGNNYGILVGVQDESNFYMAQFVKSGGSDYGNCTLYECVNGVFNPLVSTSDAGNPHKDSVYLPGKSLITCEVRVREGIIEVYRGNSATSGTSALDKLLTWDTGVTMTGSAGFRTKNSATENHLFSLNHSLRYNPREKFRLLVADVNGTILDSSDIGKIDRTNVVYEDEYGSFLLTDPTMEEDHTRNVSITKDWDYYQTDRVTLPPGDYRVIYEAQDIGIWFHAAFICDADGGSIAYFNDNSTILEFMSQAKSKWQLAGVGFWVLGNEAESLYKFLPPQN